MHITKQRKFTKLIKSHLDNQLKDYVSDSEGVDRENKEKRYEYTLQTKAGKLFVIFYLEDSAVYTVFTRFENVLNGRDLTHNSNPYSGKWNHHYSVDCIRPEDAANTIVNSLKYVCGCGE
ncbi:MAG: hypothetical protein GY804_03915 [Alphaproteobacteria bacterium]|nr:hypothetical protein [Alphaproteobacteria bacterium]